MTYVAFDKTKPDGTANGTTTLTHVRENLAAMRDAVVLGAMKGWNYSVSGGTAEQPQYVFLKNGTDWVRQTLTWGTSGGADGNVTVIVAEFSANSGGAYDAIGTLTVAYDTAGNVTTTTWS